jgi:iron complex transport system permease protein
MTGTSILLIGPISFIGLLAPHIARLTGQQRPVPFLLASAMLGAAILTLADWVGRYVAFPWEIPAGLIATFVGGFFVCAVAGRR